MLSLTGHRHSLKLVKVYLLMSVKARGVQSRRLYSGQQDDGDLASSISLPCVPVVTSWSNVAAGPPAITSMFHTG